MSNRRSEDRFARRSFPQMRPVVAASRHYHSIVRTERHVVNSTLVAEIKEIRPGNQVPDLRHVIVAACDQAITIRTEGCAIHCLVMCENSDEFRTLPQH